MQKYLITNLSDKTIIVSKLKAPLPVFTFHLHRQTGQYGCGDSSYSTLSEVRLITERFYGLYKWKVHQFVSSTVLFLLSTVSKVISQLDPNQIQSFHPHCTDWGKGIKGEGGKRQKIMCTVFLELWLKA